MARYGYPNFRVDVDDSAGTPQNMSAYITEDSTAEIEAILQDVTAAGDANEQSAKVGLSRMAEITFGGPYDDTAATGPNAVFIGIGGAATRTVKFTWGGTKTTSVEAIIKTYRRIARKGQLTAFEAVLQPTGIVTEV